MLVVFPNSLFMYVAILTSGSLTNHDLIWFHDSLRYFDSIDQTGSIDLFGAIDAHV